MRSRLPQHVVQVRNAALNVAEIQSIAPAHTGVPGAILIPACLSGQSPDDIAGINQTLRHKDPGIPISSISSLDQVRFFISNIRLYYP